MPNWNTKTRKEDNASYILMYDYEARAIGHTLAKNKLGNDRCVQDEIPLGSLIVSLHDFPKSAWKNYTFAMTSMRTGI